MHSGYHYCSTAIEWKYLIDSIKDSQEGKPFVPKVSLEDGIQAVDMGIQSMQNISNFGESEGKVAPVTAHGSKSSENLLNHILSTSLKVIDSCHEEYSSTVQ